MELGNWRVVISATETVDGSSASLSCIEKAMDPLCSIGWAELWQGVGSIDLKLRVALLVSVWLPV